jgi:hypothetical protein
MAWEMRVKGLRIFFALSVLKAYIFLCYLNNSTPAILSKTLLRMNEIMDQRQRSYLANEAYPDYQTPVGAGYKMFP